ncbi:Bax inhibitor-1/YccA family protein [Caulobacter sp. KR2-114]|uniref:Bax inhibitor-1/YccA family protein n=1 Tax=Caulobacter sp. KR2-114 TaxID=3400912 RepID=UPI003C0D5585
MSDFHGGAPRFGAQARPDMAVDAGLRSFMLGVYNKVAIGLLLSAGLAWFTGHYAPVQRLLFQVDGAGHVGYTILGMVVAFAPLGILLFQSFARQTSPQAASITYWVVVSLIGASLGMLFAIYADAAIYQTFLVTAAAFGGLSLVGYTTKRDLSGFGSFLIMGLWGLIFASLATFFFHSAMLVFIINLLGVGIFAGLIAFDTQRMKMTYYQLGGNQAAMSVATSYGALSLYLDFINLFRFLLYFMGGSRR